MRPKVRVELYALADRLDDRLLRDLDLLDLLGERLQILQNGLDFLEVAVDLLLELLQEFLGRDLVDRQFVLLLLERLDGELKLVLGLDLLQLKLLIRILGLLLQQNLLFELELED